MNEKQITFAKHGHMLTNAGVWSPDGCRVVYDVRSKPDGSVFDGTRIETVDVRSGEIRVLYESKHGACCGVPTYSPVENKIVFILGPENPTSDWQYGFHRRQGAIVDESQAGPAVNLEARNLTPPFTPGALRGGTHLHLFSPDGELVLFTYHDLLVPTREDHRNIGVSLLGRPILVPKEHERNHDGEAFSVLVTRTTANPESGSDQILRASEEAWIGASGKMIAFLGEVISADGKRKSEVYAVELPEDLTVAGGTPLEGSNDMRPAPPRGTVQRRLTFTQNGIEGPRHWLRGSPDGSRIGFLMRDDRGVVQFWTVTPTGNELRQVTRGDHSVESAFTWSPDGNSVAMVIGGNIGVLYAQNGEWREIAPQSSSLVRPEACVFSPSGDHVAYMRHVDGFNQIFVARVT